MRHMDQSTGKTTLKSVPPFSQCTGSQTSVALGARRKSNMDLPSSLRRSVSPPLRRRRGSATIEDDGNQEDPQARPSLAAIEAGEAKIRDHLQYFSEHLRKASRPIEHSSPRLSIDDFVELYSRNQHPHGHHFVIHQHNHPVAGVHCESC